MRIAFLCKRRYMRHDVIVDRYARLYELPHQLALLGHDVLGLCLDYRPSVPVSEHHATTAGSLRWQSWSLGRALLPGAIRYRAEAFSALRDFAPDVIVGASDSVHAVLARYFARLLQKPYAIDLYDNFETFSLTRIPGMKAAFRHAVREADLVTCVSQPLQQMIATDYRARGKVEVLESTIGGDTFRPRDRDACRAELGLPRDAILIGTAGALDVERGIDQLYRAFNELAARQPRLHLALAGVANAHSPVPAGERIHYLGQLPHDRVAVFNSALDVGVICIRDTPFGRFSFPQKAFEMAAARIPLVVASVGAMRAVFTAFPQCLYDPSQPDDLRSKLTRQMAAPVVPAIDIPDWRTQATLLENMLRALV